MAKAPIPGSVKTRLVPVFSAPQAAALARALLIDQLEHLRAFRNADLYLAFTPLSARRLIRRLTPTRFEIFPQRGAGLGVRMQNIFATLFARGYQRIVLIGGDLPPVPLSHFAQAFTYLDHPKPRAVLGPSLDGGYYLIGLNREQPAVFAGMTWGHDRVLAQALEKLDVNGVQNEQLRTWFDVDTIDDVQRLLLLGGSSTKAMKKTLSLLYRRPLAKLLAGHKKAPESVLEFTHHGCTLSGNVRSLKSGG
jgi:rSAM/selenodomain-associated transferase 1